MQSSAGDNGFPAGSSAGSGYPAATAAATSSGNAGDHAPLPGSGTDDAESDRQVLSAADVGRTLSRIAHQILEHTDGGRDVVLLGIPTRGVAARPPPRRASIAEFEGLEVPVGSLDTTMYRDDLRLRGIRPLETTDLPDDSRRQGRRARRRRPLLRAHRPRGAGRPQRPRPPPRGSARRPRRPRAPRAADPRRLRRQEPPDQPGRVGARPAARDGRPRRRPLIDGDEPRGYAALQTRSRARPAATGTPTRATGGKA